jgi:hypothetical protein
MLAYGKLSTDLMAYGQGVKSALGLEFSGQVRAASGQHACPAACIIACGSAQPLWLAARMHMPRPGQRAFSA